MMVNLDPCPFCGGKGKITAYTTSNSEVKFYAYCESCGVISPHFDTIDECVNWWNTRVISEKNAKLIANAYGGGTHCENCHCREEETFSDEDYPLSLRRRFRHETGQ